MRTQNRPFRLTATIAVSGLLLAQGLPQPALAQTAPPPQASAPDQQTGDPPTRVGRLALVSGTVSFHTQDESQWNPASPNYPIVQGNAFWTQPSAQATIQVSASTIVMASETELDVTTLNDTAFQGTLPQGEVYAHVQAASPNETYAVQTPRGLVTLSSPGRYSVAAGDTQAPTLVTIVEGSAHITGPGVDLDVHANQTATITGTDTFQAQVDPAQRDPFLTAMLAREQPRPPQPQSVAPPPAVAAMPGGDQLAEYGTWSDNSQYGQVWYPQVQSNWVPYRDGRWAYVAPWGWTWVDSDPWGFAPFHYGRWAQINGRWGWMPGAAVAGYAGPPVYAPALVTFFGVGAGVAVGVGIGAALARGNIGWCPLGPREVYRPWYSASPAYVRNVNVTHVTNVTNITTINRNVTINNFVNRGAATVVPDKRNDRIAADLRARAAGDTTAARAGQAGVRQPTGATCCHYSRRNPGRRAAVQLSNPGAGDASCRAWPGHPRNARSGRARRRRGRTSAGADAAQSRSGRVASGCGRPSVDRDTNSASTAGAGTCRTAGNRERSP